MNFGQIFSQRRILVIAAHPDDEILGLGATLNRIVKETSSKVKVVILGEGITSRSDNRDTEQWKLELEQHRSNIMNAKSAIGYHELSTYNLPDNRFDSGDLLDIIKIVEKEKSSFNPNLVFTHHGGDLNIDHQLTFQAVMTACRPIQQEDVVTILTFETPSSTEWQSVTENNPFLPTFYVEVDEQNLQSKIKAMESYEYESRKFPHPRSPEALRTMAQMCGIKVGSTYAEAFSLVRMIARSGDKPGQH